MGYKRAGRTTEKEVLIGRILDKNKHIFYRSVDEYMKFGRKLARMNVNQLKNMRR